MLIPLVMSEELAKHVAHVLTLFGTIGTPHRQHRTCGRVEFGIIGAEESAVESMMRRLPPAAV